MSEVYTVIATQTGHYGQHRRRGERFDLDLPEDFSGRWMRAVGWVPPHPVAPEADVKAKAKGKE